MKGRLFTVWLLLAAVVLYGEAAPVLSGDSTLPLISDLRVTPQSGPRGTRYSIAVKIVHPQGAGDITAILYLVREQSELIRLEINDAGQHADTVAGDGIYTAESIVPDTAARGAHDFHLFVRGRDGHQSNILQYRFTVVRGPRLIPV